ncbi:MAG: 23S rRNA (adenine(1618)-N(6))-methyltransferase RlmF [Aureispira sp.]
MPFHSRNKYQGSYDLKQLVEACPTLHAFVITKKDGQLSLDFGQAEAVFLLNKTLLSTQYQVNNWALPEGALCPPIPSRADYLHHLADLLGTEAGLPPRGKKTKILDIGTGASCIYPLLGTSAYGWSFIGADSNAQSIQWAHQFLMEQKRLRALIELRFQNTSSHIFQGIIKKQDKIAATICNPPFYKSAKEALEQQQRKWRQVHPQQPSPNFGGQAHELHYVGGEVAFIKKMILESQLFQQQVQWFTTLVAQEKHLKTLYQSLKKANVARIETLEMQHGNKKSRVLCWAY